MIELFSHKKLDARHITRHMLQQKHYLLSPPASGAMIYDL